ncbi:MAG TPA: class I SAM-dependent methyltransferase [Candidatus Binatia bacterium]|nr:class I SAM-dependent methyltransferase [Candidatus Binatia bacterium]
MLPRLIDLAMRGEIAAAERRRLAPRAAGRVLEVGFGSGLNLAHYGSEVSRVLGVDPSWELWRRARKRVQESPVRVDFAVGTAERLPLAAASVDTAVLTWTLCSVEDPGAALAEIRRVLAPGGHLLFVEHGSAPEPGVRRWQDRLTPFWRRAAGGCHLNRDIPDLIRRAGFALSWADDGYARGPRPFTYFFRGVAQEASGERAPSTARDTGAPAGGGPLPRPTGTASAT